MTTLYLMHPIQLVPTQHSKGVFVFGTLYNQVLVGPTALDQASRVDHPNPHNDNKYLLTLVREYVGIRRGTNHCDY